MAAWDNFLVAQVGASAALAGLLFVGISINMARILRFPALPDRALEALTLLITILIAASLALVPGMPDFWVGVELIAVGGVALAILTRLVRRVLSLSEPAWRIAHEWESATIEAAAALYLVAGGLLIVGGPGDYALVPAFLLSYIVAIMISWILLVEINR